MSQGIHLHWNKVHVHLHPFLLSLLLTPLSLNFLLTHECTHSHYQDSISTYHSSQLTPIYPRAFKKPSEKTREWYCISATSTACEDQSTPMGDRQKASDSPQCSAAKWNNANRVLITTSLVCSFQLAAITLSVNSPTKSQTITP